MMDMIRPDWNRLARILSLGNAYVYCSCGAILQTQEQAQEHWERGHFDYIEEKDKGDKP